MDKVLRLDSSHFIKNKRKIPRYIFIDKFCFTYCFDGFPIFLLVIHLHILQDDGLHDSSKIAAFDFDGCLAKTAVKKYVCV